MHKHKHRGLFLVLALLIAITLGCIVVFFPLYVKGTELRDILVRAKTVVLAEYSFVDDKLNYTGELTSAILTPQQITRISDVFATLGLMGQAKTEGFEPHHVLICTMPDDTVRAINICFRCDEISIDDGPPFNISSWQPDLKTTIERSGVPIRPERYRMDTAL